MTHDELKTITERTQEEIIQPPEKTKREVKGSLRFNIPKRKKSDSKNDNGLFTFTLIGEFNTFAVINEIK